MSARGIRQEVVIEFNGRLPAAKSPFAQVVALPLAMSFLAIVVRVLDISKRREECEMLHNKCAVLQAEVNQRTADLKEERAERNKIERNLSLAAKVIQTNNEVVIITNEDFRVESVNSVFADI